MIGLIYLRRERDIVRAARDRGLELHAQMLAQVQAIDSRLQPRYRNDRAGEIRGRLAEAFFAHLNEHKIFNRLEAALKHEPSWSASAYVARAKFLATSTIGAQDDVVAGTRLLPAEVQAIVGGLPALAEATEGHRQAFAASRMSLDDLRLAWFDAEASGSLASLGVLLREIRGRAAAAGSDANGARSLAGELTARLDRLELPERSEATAIFAELREFERELRVIRAAIEHGDSDGVDVIRRGVRISELRAAGKLAGSGRIAAGDPLALLQPVGDA